MPDTKPDTRRPANQGPETAVRESAVLAGASMPVAVVGVSTLFAGSADAGGFWRDILAGRDLITDVPPSHWLPEDYYDPDPKAPDKTYARRGSFLDDVDFDPVAFGIPPSIVPATDTSQLLALIVARQVLDDATQGQFDALDKRDVSIILGVTSAQELLGEMAGRLQRPIWVKALREMGLPESRVQEACERIAEHYVPWQESTFPGLLGNVVAGRIANRFDLGGTNSVTDAACASAFSALSMAVHELYLGHSKLVITGGVDTFSDIFMQMCFSKTPALSMSGDVRPFSDRADGTLLGEGLGMVALKRLEDAERDGDRIYAVLRGIGSSSDGRAKSVYAPLPEGQARAVRRAYERAGYGPETVELVEAHGTGTKAGDAAEVAGLKLVFGEAADATATAGTLAPWCALGSVKSQVGHTKAAAGAAGLFKVIMALHHKVLPGGIKIDRPNPKLELDASPFYLNVAGSSSTTESPRPWIRGGDHPRRAGVSAFGFGGSNFHLTLEEYRGAHAAPRFRPVGTELLLLSAEDVPSLARRCRRLAQEARRAVADPVVGDLAAGQSWLAWLAHSTQIAAAGDAAWSRHQRLAVVTTDAAELADKLERAAGRLEGGDRPEHGVFGGGVYGSDASSATDGAVDELAFLFPGQGSQRLHMGAELAANFDGAREVWDLAADVQPELSRVVFPPPTFPLPTGEDPQRAAQEARLTETHWAQPALGAASLAQLALLRRLGLEPDCVAGHSFGEVTALAAAGVLDAASALRVARRRGELMTEAAARATNGAGAAAGGEPGAMLAVAASPEDLRPLLEAPEFIELSIANHNAPRQVVLSGPESAIDSIAGRLKEDGLKVKKLDVHTAFHSPHVSSSSRPFADFLSRVEMQPPRLPVIANADAQPYPQAADAVRTRLAEQLSRPVLFVEQVEALYARGVRTFVEVGPGSVLTQLVRKCLGERPHLAVSLERKSNGGLAGLWHALGRLAASGRRLDFAALWQGFRVPEDPHQRPRPKMTLSIRGSNYGRPYPPPGGAAELPGPNPEEQPAISPVQPAVQPAVSLEAPVLPAGPAATATRGPESESNSMSEIPTKPATAPAGPAAAPSAAAGSDWMRVYQEAQRQMVETHSAFQRTMADTQMAFLRTAEASFQNLTTMLSGQPASSQLATPQLAVSQPAVVSQPAAPQPGAPAQVPGATSPSVQPTLPSEPPAPEPVAAPVSQPRVASSVDVGALVLDVVAEKTGYPAEMLSAEMDLEADLGIDSIKRVEILSALRERAPELPELEAAELGALHTLGQITERLGAPTATEESPVAATPAHTIGARSTAAPDLEPLVLDVVAEKTGYPAEMLSAEMDLEADLGIDSIKRVEILSALRERAPELPELEAAELGALHTLGQIVDRLGGAPAGTGAVAQQQAALPEITPALPATQEIEAAPSRPVEPPAREAAPLGRFVPRLQERPAVGVAPAGLAAGLIAILDAGSGIGDALAAELAEQGLDVVVSEHVPASAASLIFLGGLVDPTDSADSDRVAYAAFEAARAFARQRQDAAGDDRQEAEGVFVTVQDTGGSFLLDAEAAESSRSVGLSGAWLAGLSGLAKTAAQEWPGVAVKVIDLQRGGRSAAAVARVLADELLAGGAHTEVALSADGCRRVVVSAAEALPQTAGTDALPPLNGNDVLVVSGGARGVTAACVLELARRAPGLRLALLGRTPLAEEPAAAAAVAATGPEAETALKRALLDDARNRGETPTPAELGRAVSRLLAGREVRATLAALEATGARPRYLAVDVQDALAVGAALAELRRDWGPITGVVHAAGVLADKFIADKTPEQVARVYGTKVGGLRTLLDATAGDPLRLLCLFSSVAGRCGNRGQADYAMANEVLNKVAHAEAARRSHNSTDGPACRVLAVGWGPWQGGMVTAELSARFAEQGVPLIPLDEGARRLADELTRGTDVEVVIGGEPRLAPLVGAESPRRWSLDVWLSARRHDYLSDHRLDGTAVLPVAVVLHWFRHLAEACCPSLVLAACQDLQVLRGVRLDDYDGGRGERLRLAARLISNGPESRLALELTDAAGHARYRATAEMAPRPPHYPAAPPAPAGLEPWDREPFYDGDVLFHGPAFQVLQQLDGVATEGHDGLGLAARLTTGAELGWYPSARAGADPGTLDGALQLAVLAFERKLGGASLPTAVDTWRLYGELPVAGPLRAVVHARQLGNDHLRCDVFLSTETGELAVELRGVSIHRRPDVAASSTPDSGDRDERRSTAEGSGEGTGSPLAALAASASSQ